MAKVSKAVKFFDNEVGNQFFTVKFVKKSTGEIRTLNGRKGVTRYIKGAGGNNKPDHIRVVWDRVNGGYRSFDVRTLLEVRCKGQVVGDRLILD